MFADSGVRHRACTTAQDPGRFSFAERDSDTVKDITEVLFNLTIDLPTK